MHRVKKVRLLLGGEGHILSLFASDLQPGGQLCPDEGDGISRTAQTVAAVTGLGCTAAWETARRNWGACAARCDEY